jgi:hypothetical protein
VTDESIPEGLGSSWVGQPVNLAAGGWTTCAFVLALVAIFLLARRWLSGEDKGASYSRNFKEK